MPKRNCEFIEDNDKDKNYLSPDIDIAQYLFDEDWEQVSKHAEIIKTEVHVHDSIRSPLRLNENVPQTPLDQQQSSSSSQEKGLIYNDNLDEENNSELIRNTNDKSIKNKLYAKNYREKKKERLTILEEENRFLKSKIDDLSFRLKEAELEINKLKHNHENNTQNYQTARAYLLKEIETVLEKEESNTKRLLEVEQEIRKINAFDSKHRMDLLNYFMSELLENLLSDMGVYFVECMVEKKGAWRENDSVPLSKIDLEVMEIIGEEQWDKTKEMVNSLPPMVLEHFVNFKVLWKNLYQDYLNIINEGTLIESMTKSMCEHDEQNTHKEVLSGLKLELYFEKIKYRKDMRQMREIWFHEIENEEKSNTNKKICKRVKLIP